MKAIKLLVFSLVAMSFSGCTDELFDLKFNMPTVEVKYTLKASATAGEFILPNTVISLNIDSIAKANGTDLSKFKKVLLKKVTVEILNPATANFDILESGEINFSAGIMGDPDFDLLRIASFTKTDIQPGSRTFDIVPTTDVDVMPFTKRKSFTVSGKLVTNGPVAEDVELKFTLFTEVTANPIGQ